MRIVFILLALCCLCCGCTSEAPTSNTDSTSSEQSSAPVVPSADELAAPEIEVVEEEAQPETTDEDLDTADSGEDVTDLGDSSTDESGGDQPDLDSAMAYMQAMQKLFAGMGKDGPQDADIVAAIEMIKAGMEKFPADPMLPQVHGALMMSRVARAVKDGNLDDAWKLVEESRSELPLGALRGPEFADLLMDKQRVKQLNDWIHEGVRAEMEAQESFPFDFKLQSFDGKEVSLSDYQGKPVLVDIWGTWCPPCRDAIPHLVKMHEEYGDKLNIVGINFEQNAGAKTFEDAKAKLEEFTASQPISYPCLHGNRELIESIPGFQGFPTMLLLDAEGKVRLMVTGFNQQKIESAVSALLEG